VYSQPLPTNGLLFSAFGLHFTSLCDHVSLIKHPYENISPVGEALLWFRNIILGLLVFNFSTRVSSLKDRLCGLVVRVPDYRSRDPGSIPGLPDFLRNIGSGTAVAHSV
jgi:hypothetical protein